MDNLQTYIITHKGKHHDSNQDAANILILENAVFLAIADGVTTSVYGKDAAEMAVKEVCEYINANYQLCNWDLDYRQLLHSGFCHVLKYFWLNKLNMYHYATTLSVALVQTDGTAHIGHVGDGGIITIDSNGKLHYVTHQMRLQGSDNVVIPFSCEDAWEFITLNHKVSSIFLATDGALSELVEQENFVECSTDSRKVQSFLEQFRERKSWDDDATIVAAIGDRV